MKMCIICSTENDDSAMRCKVCNGMFFVESSNPTSNVSRKVDNNRTLCSNCRKYISTVGFSCPYCGYSIEASQRDMGINCHLRLYHTSGYQIILTDNDVIGRGFNGEEVLKRDLYVSHAHIRVRKVGKYFELQDISGGNSFFVNMHPIGAGGTAIVGSGDVVKIGVTNFRVKIVQD